MCLTAGHPLGPGGGADNGGAAAQSALYRRTRRRILSNATNPYFWSGPAGEGVGGPHVGLGWIWPMSVIMRALTSEDDAEIQQCLATLVGAALNNDDCNSKHYQ